MTYVGLFDSSMRPQMPCMTQQARTPRCVDCRGKPWSAKRRRPPRFVVQTSCAQRCSVYFSPRGSESVARMIDMCGRGDVVARAFAPGLSRACERRIGGRSPSNPVLQAGSPGEDKEGYDPHARRPRLKAQQARPPDRSDRVLPPGEQFPVTATNRIPPLPGEHPGIRATVHILGQVLDDLRPGRAR